MSSNKIAVLTSLEFLLMIFCKVCLWLPCTSTLPHPSSLSLTRANLIASASAICLSLPLLSFRAQTALTILFWFLAIIPYPVLPLMGFTTAAGVMIILSTLSSEFSILTGCNLGLLLTRRLGEISIRPWYLPTALSMARSLSKLVSVVILDLDGTLLNTDGIVSDILKVHLVKYGKQWDGRKAHRIVGKKPLEAAAAVVEDYELPITPDEFLAEIKPMLSGQWCNIKAQPGANRLINHLRVHSVPMALASNSPRENVETKISYHRGWKESFSVIIGGDEVTNGKPSPEIFLEAARRLDTDPSSCLVIEDSLPGVTAGKAAGMDVVAVPSVPKRSHLYTSADEVINSLLDLQLEKWSLPAFQDWIEGTLPIKPWHIGGPVIKGFGRGSKVLGIPTANLSTEDYLDLLSEHPSGVYFGWAGLPTHGVFKMVMSIGWNPYFNNAEKTIEPWLLHDFSEDFYGEELHLVIVGYIRPEANFPSLESLVAKIYEDRKIAERALELPQYSKYKEDPYLTSPSPSNN